MHYKEYAPCAKLAKFIKCFWFLERDDTSIPPEKERVFPDGCIELIFHYGDLFLKYNRKHKAEIQPRSFIHGQLKKFIELEATGKIGTFGVRFQPGGLHPFIQSAVSDFTEITVPVAHIWPETGAAFEASIMEASNPLERIAIAEEFLLSHLVLQPSYDIVTYCVNTIITHAGNISIDDLATTLHTGRRNLERKFITSVGLSPKFLARIVRFNQTLQLIEANDFSSFTAVAYEGGFYDQAHFIKDFREFTGVNPRQYFSGNLELVRFFNLE